MRRTTKHIVIALASSLVLLAPTVLAAAPERDLGEMLEATQNPTPHASETGPEANASSSEEFVLGVRNRPQRERATPSIAIGADAGVPADEPARAGGTRYRPSVSEWWHDASQTKKTATIVGGAVVFLIIFV